MSCGLRQAGIKVIAGIDIDKSCKETYEFNNPDSKFVLADIHELSTRKIVKLLGLRRNDKDLVMVGCSPCQFWSIIQTDKTKSKKSRNLLLEFGRFVFCLKPGYVLVENVPGILTRGDESGLSKFLIQLKRHGYQVHYEIINMSEYGVPQSRRRFSLVATRMHERAPFPKAHDGPVVKVSEILGNNNGFQSISEGRNDPTAFYHSTSRIGKRNLMRLRKTRSNGGSWLDWGNERELRRDRYRGKRFTDNYGRMRWEHPAPTITTKFISISNGRFGHPEEHRALSIREGAALQTFPREYVFVNRSMKAAARMIGNAVPPHFARQLGEAIVKAHKDIVR